MIKNLLPQLNVAGLLKIGKKGEMITSQGGKEFRPPVKLDHFLITTTEKDQSGDYVRDTELENRIKEAKTGVVNQNGELIGVPIRFLYNDMELNFPTRLASYVSGKLSCTGDGETATKRIDDFQKQHPCPCPRCEHSYDGKDKCKHMGALSCILDEAGLFGQIHKFRTTSINSVKGIMGGIKLIQDATNGRIAGLPLMLTLNAKATVTPGGQNTTVYVVSVCYRGSMQDLRNEVLQLIQTERQYIIGMEKMEAEAMAALPEKPMESEQDQLDVAQEFFPDGLDVIEPEIEEMPETKSKAIQEPEPATVSTNIEPNSAHEPPNGDTQIQTQSQVITSPAPTSIAPAPEKNLLEVPQGTYKTLYNKLIQETDYDTAIALTKRLTKGNLVYFLTENYPGIELQDGVKKPELLNLCEESLAHLVGETGIVVGPEDVKDSPEFIAIQEIKGRKEFVNAVSDYFKPLPIDRTLSRDELLEKVKQAMSNKQTNINQSQAISEVIQEQNKTENKAEDKTESNPDSKLESEPKNQTIIALWDENGLIEKPQLIQIVKLKKDLEMLGKLDATDPNQWPGIIGRFVGPDGNPQTTATELSKIQGNVLIEWMENLDVLPF